MRLFFLLIVDNRLIYHLLLLNCPLVIHHHKLLPLIIFAIVFIALIQYIGILIILNFQKVVIYHIIKLSLLRIFILCLFPQAHRFITRLRSSNSLGYNKLEIVASLPPEYRLMARLSAIRDGLLMHLKFDYLFFIEDILNLYLAHLGQGDVSVALKVLPVN